MNQFAAGDIEGDEPFHVVGGGKENAAIQPFGPVKRKGKKQVTGHRHHSRKQSGEDSGRRLSDGAFGFAVSAGQYEIVHALIFAGENRGITTCLSASAGALRYRLGQVIRKRSVTSGALTAAVIFFLLSMTSGYVTLAFGDYRVEEVLFEDGAGFDDATLYGINTSLFEHNGFLQCRDEEALCAYLSELSLVKLGGDYAEPEEIPQLLLFFDTETCSAALRMEGQALTVIPLGKTARKSAQYFIRETVDWDYLSSFLLTYSIQSADLPFPPKITLFGDHSYMDFTGQVVLFSRNGQSQPRESWWDDDDAPGFVDLQETALRIDFSHTLKDGYRVEVTDLEGNVLDSFSSRDLTDPGVLPLDYPNACYTVWASFEDDTSSIDMKYTFTLERSENP